MKAALYRIFCKGAPMLLALLMLFVAMKWYAVASISAPDLGDIDHWVADCAGLDGKAVEAYILSVYGSADKESEGFAALSNGISAFNSGLLNRTDVERLISFAKNKEGILPADVPGNYTEVLDFYAELDAPSIINGQPLDIYFALQEGNFVPILVLFLCLMMWGPHFEAEIYRCTGVACQGRRYHRSLRHIIMGLGLGMLLANELFDLLFSGMLHKGMLWSATIQSYPAFRECQMNGTIGQGFVFMWCSKIAGVLILCWLAEYIAQWKKTLKDAAVYTLFIVIALQFFGRVLSSSMWQPLLQVGIVDWKQIFARCTILSPDSISSAVLGGVVNGCLLLYLGMKPMCSWIVRCRLVRK